MQIDRLEFFQPFAGIDICLFYLYVCKKHEGTLYYYYYVQKFRRKGEKESAVPILCFRIQSNEEICIDHYIYCRTLDARILFKRIVDCIF